MTCFDTNIEANDQHLPSLINLVERNTKRQSIDKSLLKSRGSRDDFQKHILCTFAKISDQKKEKLFDKRIKKVSKLEPHLKGLLLTIRKNLFFFG